MKLLTSLLVLGLIIGCNQQDTSAPDADNQSKKPTVEKQVAEAASSTKESNEHSGHEHSGHDHSSHTQSEANADGYIEVEPKDVCGQPTITYFFAYQCPHCFELEKFTSKWLKTKPDNIIFNSVPTDLGRQEFGPFLLVHHAAAKLNILDKVKPVLFDLIHNKKELIQSLEQATLILTNAGAKMAEAETALKDETALLAKLKSDYDTNIRYKITGVPAVLVNYQYKTGPVEAKGYDKVFEVVEKALELPAKCVE